MKKIEACILVFFCLSFCTIAQKTNLSEGTVSHVTSTNIYVSLNSSEGIEANDTLVVLIKDKWIKALKVEIVSSKSCLTKSIVNDQILVGYKVMAPLKFKSLNTKESLNSTQKDLTNTTDTTKTNLDTASNVNTSNKKVKLDLVKQIFNIRFSVSTNGSMDNSEKQYNRIRYSLNFDINNINGGKFSLENYITYRRRFGEGVTQASFNEDFKIYSMSLNYEASKNTSFALGRRINNRMANMGAIDGIQTEYKYKKLFFGAFAGFRPDDLDYSFNMKLLQFGGVVSHEADKGKGQMQTSIALAEQKNNGNTDRRFIYIQHINSVFNNINLFYSLELDVFQKINGVVYNKFNLTSTYASLRYKPFKKLSLTTSYDNRKNVIYYETYRSYLDQLLTQETRQGFRLNTNYNITKTININATGFYRYQESRPEPTKNYTFNFTKSQIMGPGSTLNFSLNNMKTYYFNGNIYGARFTKEMFKSKLSTEFNYRKVNYIFTSVEQPNMVQDIFGLSLNTFGKKGSSLLLSYEGTFEPLVKYNRYYVTFSQRIRNKK
jgi:hypothetical protein